MFGGGGVENVVLTCWAFPDDVALNYEAMGWELPVMLGICDVMPVLSLEGAEWNFL